MTSWLRIRRYSGRRQSKSHVVQISQIETTAEEQSERLLVPETQAVLLLHGARQPYQLTEGYAVPKADNDHELLVKVQVIGLNPIDWKAPYVEYLASILLRCCQPTYRSL